MDCSLSSFAPGDGSEDGTFNTVEEDEYELPESGKIGLIHPLEVSKELIEAWREQLTDYEITQPIIQLERNIYEVEPQEEENKELERFGGYVINHLSFAEKLMANGSILPLSGSSYSSSSTVLNVPSSI